MPKPPARMQRAYPLLRGHDATQICAGYIHPLDAHCICGATFRTPDGAGVVVSGEWTTRSDAGGNSISVHPLAPEPKRRRNKMRSRSRDRLLTLSIVALVIVVLALFALPWVYLATATGVDDSGGFAIWTAGIEIFVVGVAAVVGIVLILQDN